MGKRVSFAEIDLPAGALRELTEAVRACCISLSDSGFSMRAIAEACLVGKTTLYSLSNGVPKRPDRKLLESLHRLAAEHAAPETALPSLQDLIGLHRRVLSEADGPVRCGVCGSAPGTPGKPALLPGLPTGPEIRLPVPPSVGDRQVADSAIVALKERLAAEQMGDAAGIMRHLGQQGHAYEAADAIAACHLEGLTDVAAAIASYAVRRADDEIFTIAGRLLDAGSVDAARNLVTLRLERQ